MPQIPNYYAPSVKSVSGAPKDSEWADRFIAARDAQIKLLTSELQGSATATALSFELVTVPFLANTPVLVRARKSTGPIAGVLLLSSSPDDPDAIVVTPSSTIGECEVEALFLNEPATPVFVKLLLVFGS